MNSNVQDSFADQVVSIVIASSALVIAALLSISVLSLIIL